MKLAIFTLFALVVAVLATDDCNEPCSEQAMEAGQSGIQYVECPSISQSVEAECSKTSTSSEAEAAGNLGMRSTECSSMTLSKSVAAECSKTSTSSEVEGAQNWGTLGSECPSSLSISMSKSCSASSSYKSNYVCPKCGGKYYACGKCGAPKCGCGVCDCQYR